VWRQATDFEELKPEGLDLCEDAIERRTVRQCSRKYGVRSARLSLEGGERRAHHRPQAAAYPDLVLQLLRHATCCRDFVIGHETGQLLTVVS
jgi:hypothetical protein